MPFKGAYYENSKQILCRRSKRSPYLLGSTWLLLMPLRKFNAKNDLKNKKRYACNGWDTVVTTENLSSSFIGRDENKTKDIMQECSAVEYRYLNVCQEHDRAKQTK